MMSRIKIVPIQNKFFKQIEPKSLLFQFANLNFLNRTIFGKFSLS